MRLGIFAKTFARPTVEGVFEAVAAAGVDCVQFNLSCAGLEPLPPAIEPSVIAQVRAAADRYNIELAAVSGTFNMAHPDPAYRAGGLARLAVLAVACAELGTSVITLCTGSRDRQNMWRRRPENDSPEAWNDMLASITQAVEIADRTNVTLAIEPEVSNVVDSAAKARRLLDEIGSSRLKVVLDGANLFPAGTLPRMCAILDEACDLLGPDIVLAHAKDLAADGEAGDRAAGTGLLDYDHYLAGLARVGYQGPLILHGLREDEVGSAVRFLRERLARLTR